MPDPFLELKAIAKRYPGVVALEAVDFSVASGEVIGLVGENGAGKSTLMKILGGVEAPTAGTIRVDGVAHERLTVATATAAGIAFVHQELNLFENLTVAANVLIGREPLRRGFLKLIDRRELDRRVAPLLDQLGADFGPATPVADLSLAQMQLVEIAKALSLKSRLVIMDEPTSSLTNAETERLMAVIANLKRQGVAAIFISHRLNEVKRCADRVFVLRDGRQVAMLEKDEIAPRTMIRHMIGRDLKTLYRPAAAPPGGEVLEIAGFQVPSRPGYAVDLALRQGEILGLAGLVGSGRTELARAVFGLDRKLAGTLRLGGEPIDIGSPGDAVARGIYLVPEDRKRAGLILDFTIAGNVSLASLGALSHHGLVDGKAERDLAETQRRSLDIRCSGTDVEAASLSGGNQQKVVLAKWLSMRPRVLIFDEPTRGIDVGAKSEIYAHMRKLADEGVGILMISSDMEEVIGVSDRIAVMHEGRIAGFLARPEFSEAAVLALAVGRSVN